MSASSGNGFAEYRVIYPAAVLQELRRLRDSVASAEDLQRFTAALRVIRAHLRSDPLGFGETRFAPAGSPLTVRAASFAPLVVRFAVHQKRRYVWVYGFHMLSH